MNLYRCIFRLENTTAKKEKEIIEHFLSNKNVFRVISIMGGWDLVVDFVVPDTVSLFKTLDAATRNFNENLKNHYTLVIAKSFCFKRKYLNPGQRSTKYICRFGGTNKTKKLDEKDLKILKYVSMHGRATNLEIGKNTGISSKTVMKRIKSMEQQGIIQAYSAFVHPMVYGALCKRILLYVYEVSDAEKRLFEFSRFEPNVANIEKMIGKCNYELYVECFDKNEFAELMRKLKDSFRDVLYHYEVLDVNFNYQSNYLSLFE
jgi:DNA-binding Lrp family transcriptional regulator